MYFYMDAVDDPSYRTCPDPLTEHNREDPNLFRQRAIALLTIPRQTLVGTEPDEAGPVGGDGVH